MGAPGGGRMNHVPQLGQTATLQQTGAPAESEYEHSGIMCDGCGRAPITGTRWQLDHEDYCESCKSALPADTQHRMVPNQGPIKVPLPDYAPVDDTLAPRRLLVIDSPEVDWVDIFAGAVLPCGSLVETMQCGWDDLSFTAYCEDGATSTVCSINKGRNRAMYKPDFLLLRNEVYSLPPNGDFRNLLYGLQFAQVPSVNSLEAVHGLMERPWAFAALIKIMKRLGQDNFPLITQYYYPNHREMQFTPDFPVAVKVQQQLAQ